MRAVAALLFSLAWGFPYLLFTAITLRLFSRSTFHLWARVWGRGVLRILRISLHIKHFELIADAKRRIIITNHTSSLDMAWMAAILPPRSVAIGKAEIAYIPLGNLAWWAAGFLFLKRDDHQQAMKVIGDAEDLLMNESDLSLIVAPEGTRSPDGQLQNFEKGAFVLAQKTQTSVYPVVTTGAAECLPKGSLVPRPGAITVTCLPPIASESFASERLEEGIRETEKLYRDLLGEGSQ